MTVANETLNFAQLSVSRCLGEIQMVSADHEVLVCVYLSPFRTTTRLDATPASLSLRRPVRVKNRQARNREVT